MRIAHVTATFPPHWTGTGNVCYYNARELARRGHQVHVFTAAASGAPAQEEMAGFTVHRLRPLLRFGNAPFLPGLSRALYGFDLVHLHHPFIFGDIMVWFASRLWKTPYVLTHHNDLIGLGLRRHLFDAYTALVTRRIFFGASKLIAVSNDHAAHCRLASLFRARWEDVVEAPNGVDLDRFHPDVYSGETRRGLGILEGEKVILFVGALDRAHHYRRVDLLIEVVSSINENNIHLVIVGDGDQISWYENLAVNLGISSRVHFLGKVGHNDLPEFYVMADVCALPSQMQESFGMVLVESFACGTPVIASDLPGVRTVVTPGEDGWLAAPGDAGDLAEKLAHILSLPEGERLAWGRFGRRKVEQRYAWERVGSRLEEVYEAVFSDSLLPGHVSGKARG